MKWLLLGSGMVDHHFFDYAFDMYRKKYQSSDNQVIFLVVSDDTQWVKVQGVQTNYQKYF